MGEIYRALRNLGAEWATPSEDDLWTIHVRWKCHLPAASPLVSNSASTGESTPQLTGAETPDNQQVELMKMRIQLYQLEQNNYLVDFKFDGWQETEFSKKKQRPQEFDTFSAYPFLHLATKLIMELAVNSQAA
jgi:carbon catabolite-derepressing protein kinase